MNIFDMPQKYRKKLLRANLVHYKPDIFSGKSLISVFFTRYCPVECPFCFYKSAPAKRKKIKIPDQFSEEGIQRFINFANDANLGYLHISGGGEPTNVNTAILRCVEEVNADRIVLITSGVWAMSAKRAKNYVEEILVAIRKRKKPAKVVIRLSISEGHSIKLGLKPARNLINLFEKEISTHPYLKLQLHSHFGDPMLNKLIEALPGASIVETNPYPRASDDEHIIKVIPQKLILTTASNVSFIVGLARVFHSNLRVDLNDPNSVTKAVQVFDTDIEKSEDDNPSVAFNTNGEKGLDWVVFYNGNTFTWQNQAPDNPVNIYTNDYHECVTRIMSDPITLSFLEKGYTYRNQIVEEVAPQAVLRMKAINLRDYCGEIIFEEEHVRLYYMLRVLQDYFLENRVNKDALSKLPKNLKLLITGEKESLQQLFSQSNHSLVKQYLSTYKTNLEWRDLLELTQRGHYSFSEDEMELIEARAKNAHLVNGDDVERRLTERIMHIKLTRLASTSKVFG